MPERLRRGRCVSQQACQALFLEVVPNVSDELRVGRVVQRFYAAHLRLERVFVSLQVSNEVEFRGSGSDDQQRAGVFQCLDDFVKILMSVDVLTLFRCFPLHVMVRREHFAELEALRIDLINFGLLVINPNGDEMMTHPAAPCIDRAQLAAQAWRGFHVMPVMPQDE